jgi:adenosylcobyric acid synthase
VLLVGDIDRGGVFAQLVGTIELLEEEEKDLVKGLIINKFRGDKTILDPGIEMLENISKKQVVGVTPYMDIDVEDEDSLTERMDQNREVKQIDIAVIRLPRISNFTDFNIFESIEGVSVRYVQHVGQLKNPDMIILPGTKNTMADLLWMRQSGMEAAILKAKEKGCVIFGVCGGYQMLGNRITDPQGVEEGGSIKGMGLLPMETVFAGEKTRTRVEGTFGEVDGILQGLTGVTLEGYEIHMGQTTLEEHVPSLTVVTDTVGGEQKPDGAFCGQVYGSYVHGIFDREDVVKAVVLSLAKAKGVDMSNAAAMDYAAYKELQYDKMADILRQHLDMDKIYQILEAGV